MKKINKKIFFLLFLLLQALYTIKALDPILTSIISGTCIAGIYKGIEFFYSEAKHKKELDEVTVLLSKKNKAFFIANIQELLKDSDLNNSELEALNAYELYLYPNYIEALKETCAGYSDFIKKLYHDLQLKGPDSYKIRGFDRVIHYRDGKKNRLIASTYYTYPFYDLICQLYAEILAEEMLAKTIQEEQDNQVKNLK